MMASFIFNKSISSFLFLKKHTKKSDVVKNIFSKSARLIIIIIHCVFNYINIWKRNIVKMIRRSEL